MTDAISRAATPTPAPESTGALTAADFRSTFGGGLLGKSQAADLAIQALKGLGLETDVTDPVKALQAAIGVKADGLFGARTWLKTLKALEAKGGTAASAAIASLTHPAVPPVAGTDGPKPGDQVTQQPTGPQADFDPVATGIGGGQPSGHAAEAGATPATIKALAKYEGATWVGTLPGNGGREASIIVPPGLDPTKPVEVIVFIPGTYGVGTNAVDQSLHGPSNFKDALNELGKKRNAVIVMPTLAYNHNEFKPPAEDIGAFQDAAVAKIQSQFKLKTGAMTMVGYSYGGQPLMNAAESGRIKPGTRLLTLDASYTWNPTLDIAGRLGNAVKTHGYTLHNYYNQGRMTRPMAAGSGVNHVLNGEHLQLPRKLATLLQEAYPVAS